MSYSVDICAGVVIMCVFYMRRLSKLRALESELKDRNKVLQKTKKELAASSKEVGLLQEKVRVQCPLTYT